MSSTEPVIEETEPLMVLIKQGRGHVAEMVGRFIGEIMATAMHPDNQRNQVQINGPFITIYPTEEHDITDLPVQVAIPVTGKVTVHDPEVQLVKLPRVKVLSIVHKGPYESLNTAYRRLMQHADREGLTLTAPYRELYLNNPGEVDAQDVLTKIQATIAEV